MIKKIIYLKKQLSISYFKKKIDKSFDVSIIKKIKKKIVNILISINVKK